MEIEVIKHGFFVWCAWFVFGKLLLRPTYILLHFVSSE